jgi:hypothetical protein
MNNLYGKALVAFILGFTALSSCRSGQTGPTITSTETFVATASPALLPYWDLLPLEWDPKGG